MSKRVGRPSKLTPQAVKKILQYVERGSPVTLAAHASGMTFQTLSTHRSKNPAFAAALDEAIARGVQSRLEVIERAMNSPDERIRLSSAEWWLSHVLPQHFSRTRIEVEAVGQFDHAFVIPRETLDQIAEARARHEQSRLEGDGAAK